ncbi:MAG: cyclic nucleotide-binding domain-containing protein [Actinomycetota bacterium]
MPEINLFRSAAVHRELQEGEVLFEAGQPALHMYGVISGEVTLQQGDVVLEHVGPGGIFGEVGILGDRTRSAGATASKQSVVAEIDEAEFLRLVKMNAIFALEVMRFMAVRLQRTT